jgi:hypothetical protein
MKSMTLAAAAILAAILVTLLQGAPTQAQSSLQSWVASNGTDAGNDFCFRSTPCATFQRAHDVTIPGGEVNCVEIGSYGRVTINRTISIVCEDTHGGINVSAGTNGVTINAGPNDTITLTGLNIDARGASSPVGGIVFNTGAALHVNKVRIRNIRNSSGDAGGIYFQPNSYAEFFITDSHITGSGGSGFVSGGIVITPSGSGAVNASINRVRVENNSTGILVDGTRSTGVAVNATILDTVVAGSQLDGVLARSSAGHAAASVLFDHSVASGNFGPGVRAAGDTSSGQGSAFARIGDSTIVLNAVGVATVGAGILQSFKNNRISGNLTDGTPLPSYPGPGGTSLQ